MGNPRMNCVADDLHRRPLADRGSPGRTHGNAVINPRIRVLLNRRLDGPASGSAQSLHPILPRSCDRDCSSVLKIIDNEHQSSCVRIGCQTGSSNPSTISSTTAAMPGIHSSTNPGRSCPSRSATGQQSVLYMRPLRQVFCRRHRNPHVPQRSWFFPTSGLSRRHHPGLLRCARAGGALY